MTTRPIAHAICRTVCLAVSSATRSAKLRIIDICTLSIVGWLVIGVVTLGIGVVLVILRVVVLRILSGHLHLSLSRFVQHFAQPVVFVVKGISSARHEFNARIEARSEQTNVESKMG